MKEIKQRQGYNFNGFVKVNSIYQWDVGSLSVGMAIYYNVNMSLNSIYQWDVGDHCGVALDLFLDERLLYFL